MKSKRYKICAYWLLIVAIGTLLNILLTSIFGTALPVGSHIAWSTLYAGKGLSSAGNSLLLVAAIIMALFVTVPFIICFVQSLKRARGMHLGLIIYALDTIMLIADLLSITISAVRIFLIIALVIHIIGIFLLGYGSYRGARDTSSHNYVRTLYIKRSSDGFGGVRLTCNLNGAFMCTLEQGEERLVVVDHHRQRLWVASNSTATELVLPSGSHNVSVIISQEYIDGQSKINIISADPSAQ